jgi:hypothetical protein
LGCRKDVEALPKPEQAPFNVSFSVSNISAKAYVPTAGEDSAVKTFQYFIYNNKGERVKTERNSVSQNSTSVNIKEKLEPGDYKIIFFSSNIPLDFHIADGPDEIQSFLYASSNNDIYYKSSDIKVGTSTNINASVELERLNSMLEINFLDENIPEDIATVLVTWTDNKYVDFQGASFTSGRKQKVVEIVSDGKSRKLTKFVAPLLNTGSTFNVNVSYEDSNGVYHEGAQIKDVRCFKNQKTQLAGYVFKPDVQEFISAVQGLEEKPIVASVR